MPITFEKHEYKIYINFFSHIIQYSLKVNNETELTKLPIKLMFDTKALCSLSPPLNLDFFPTHTLHRNTVWPSRMWKSTKAFFFFFSRENRWSTAMTFQTTMFWDKVCFYWWQMGIDFQRIQLALGKRNSFENHQLVFAKCHQRLSFPLA